jgi:hypothetical protein
MNMRFSEAERLFRNDQIGILAARAEGRRYLKLRSLSRSEYLSRLLTKFSIEADGSAKELFEKAYESKLTEVQLNDFIRSAFDSERKAREAQERKLVIELYKMEVFDWGGLHQNSLEKTIVDNYVKKIAQYEELEKKIEGELHESMRGYVLCSWYNHWTSILIEDIFRDHNKVIPAIGQVKKIDFFVNETPFDLKVTYLPEGFIAENRRSSGLRPELTVLRACARQHDIPFDNEMPNSKLLEDLWKKISDHPSKDCRKTLGEVIAERNKIINSIKAHPETLIVWLYENQGVRRFDASNRLFLVLIDTEDFFGSWKLKRALPRLKEGINSYLNSVAAVPGVHVKFEWEGEKYNVRSDVIVVSKP